jgi:hypothetical protein
MQTIDQRFFVTPKIIKQTATTTTIATGTATNITGMRIVLHPGQAGDGLTFRFTLAGTQTGTNAAHTILLVINGTTVQTLTADAATAVDWTAEFVLVFTGGATQRCIGKHFQDTEDPDVQYDTGAVNTQGGATIQLQATSHASDSLTVDLGIIEMWDASPMATS